MTDTALPLYTVEEYFGLVETGQLDPDARVELLEGVIVEMSPQTPRHAAATRRLHEALRETFDCEIRTQLPFIAGSRSGPEPDAVVVPGTLRDYDHRHPTEALLVAEVAHSSLPVDRLSKSRIYAGAGVPEYWIVNLVDDLLEVHRAPDRNARVYGEITSLTRGDSVNPVAAPDRSIAVGDLIPPAEFD